MEEIIQYIFQYGVGTICVAYLIFDRMTSSKELTKTMQEVLIALTKMNERLEDIEKKMGKSKKKSGEKEDV